MLPPSRPLQPRETTERSLARLGADLEPVAVLAVRGYFMASMGDAGDRADQFMRASQASEDPGCLPLKMAKA